MMKYYALTFDTSLPFIYGEAKFSPHDQGVYSNLWNDRTLPEGSKADIILTTRGNLRQDFFSVNAGFVCSEKFASILTNNPLNTRVNLLPAKVFYKDGSMASLTYYFMDFHCWVDAIDYKNSIYRTESEDSTTKIIECSQLLIDEEKASNLDWFFLKNANTFDPIVTESMANEIRKNKIASVNITSIENYSWEE